MKSMHAIAGAVLISGAAFLSLPGAPADAGQSPQTLDAREILSRLQRLERDMRDIQAETFRRTGRGPLPAPSSPPAFEPQPAVPEIGPLMRRLSELEEAFSRLTGQIEQLGYQVDQLAQRTERLQKDLEYQAQQAQASRADQAPAGPDVPGDALASLTPGTDAPGRGAPPRILGQIPAGAPLPTPPVDDPKQAFDAAMNLLSRAQYDQASQAFRNFAETYPEEARAADALYWTGDIAYSAKKDYAEAARDFAELLKRYPTAQRAPESMLKLGLALFQLGQMREGCAALAALPARYPNAPAAVATRARNERRDHMCG